MKLATEFNIDSQKQAFMFTDGEKYSYIEVDLHRSVHKLAEINKLVEWINGCLK